MLTPGRCRLVKFSTARTAAEASDAIRVANENPTRKATVDQQTVGDEFIHVLRRR